MPQLNPFFFYIFFQYKKVVNKLNFIFSQTLSQFNKLIQIILSNIIFCLFSIDYNILLYYLCICFDIFQFIYFLLCMYNMILKPIEVIICLYIYSKVRSYLISIIELFLTIITDSLLLGYLTIEDLYYISISLLKSYSKDILSIIILCIYCTIYYNSIWSEIVFFTILGLIFLCFGIMLLVYISYINKNIKNNSVSYWLLFILGIILILISCILMKKSIDLIKNSLFVFMNRFNRGDNNQQNSSGNNPGNTPGNNPGNNPGNRPGSYMRIRDANEERRKTRRRRQELRVNKPEEYQRRLRLDRDSRHRYDREPFSERKMENVWKNQRGILRVAREDAIDLNPDNLDSYALSERMQSSSQPQSQSFMEPNPNLQSVQQNMFGSNVNPYGNTLSSINAYTYTTTNPYSNISSYNTMDPYTQNNPYVQGNPYVQNNPYVQENPYTQNNPYVQDNPYVQGNLHVQNNPYLYNSSYGQGNIESNVRFDSIQSNTINYNSNVSQNNPLNTLQPPVYNTNYISSDPRNYKSNNSSK